MLAVLLEYGVCRLIDGVEGWWWVFWDIRNVDSEKSLLFKGLGYENSWDMGKNI